MRTQIIALCVLTAIGCSAHAKKVYKVTDENGNIVYSDVPKEGSKEIILPRIQTYNSNTLPKSEETQQETPKAEPAIIESYQMVFSSPQNDQVFTVEQQEIEMKLFLEPELHKDDRIRFYLDNKPVSELQQNLSFTLKALNRGTHEIMAKIYPQNGIGEAKGVAGPIKIHVQRTIVNQNSPFKAH